MRCSQMNRPIWLLIFLISTVRKLSFLLSRNLATLGPSSLTTTPAGHRRTAADERSPLPCQNKYKPRHAQASTGEGTGGISMSALHNLQTAAVSIRSVRKVYGDPASGPVALKCVDLDIRDNEFFTLLGPSVPRAAARPLCCG